MIQGFETSMDTSMKSETDEGRLWHESYNNVITHFSNDERQLTAHDYLTSVDSLDGCVFHVKFMKTGGQTQSSLKSRKVHNN